MNLRNGGSKNASKILNLDDSLSCFLMILEISNNESVISTFEYKLEGFNTWELVPDITDYKLEFMTQKFKNLNEIQHTEIFAVVKF